MKRLFTTLAVLASSTACFLAQTAQFTSANQSLLHLNPSFAGTNGFIRNQFSYQNRWPNLSGSRVALCNTLDGYVKPLRAGIGIGVLTEDQAHGRYKRNSVAFSYAQHFRISEAFRLIPSVQITRWISALDRNAVSYGDHLHDGVTWDNPQMVPRSRRNWTDLSLGLLSNYKDKLFAGIAADHVNRPDYAHLPGHRMAASLVAHLSYNFSLTGSTLLQTGVIVVRQGEWEQVRVNANLVVCKRLLVGAGLSSASSGVVSLGFRGDMFALQYTIERTQSLIDRGAGGLSSHELHLSVNFRDRDRRRELTSFETM